jgi:O-antigen ligase
VGWTDFLGEEVSLSSTDTVSGLNTGLAKRGSLTLISFLQYGLWLLLLTVPFHSVVVIPGVSVVKAIGFVVAPFWLTWLVVRLGNSRWSWVMPRQNLRIFLSLAAFIASILLSALYDSPSPVFLTSLTSLMLGSGMAIFIWTLAPSEAVLRRAYASLAVGGTILGLLVIFQFMAPQEVSRIFGARIFLETIGETTVVRATGTFRDPNYAALTLTVLACLSFYLALTYRRLWQRTLLLLGVAAQLVAVFLTFSRAGYITLALVSLAILWREKHRIRFWKAALVAAPILVLLVGVGEGVFGLVSARAKTVIDFLHLLEEEPGRAREVDLSLWYRFQLLHAGIKMAFDKFPLGVGWENFRYRVTRYSQGVPEQGAHNTYVAIAAELGLPGLVALVWLFWLLWRSTGRLCKHGQGAIGLFSRGARYGLLSVLISGLFLTVFHEAVVWGTVGLVLAQNQIALNAAEPGKIGTFVRYPSRTNM